MTKTVNIDESIHKMLVEKNKEFKQKHGFEIPYGTMIGILVKRYIQEVDFNLSITEMDIPDEFGFVGPFSHGGKFIPKS